MLAQAGARSFAISLAIAITIFGPGTSGFTIDRNKGIKRENTQQIDLLAEETVVLPVISESRASNDSSLGNNEENPGTTATNSRKNDSGSQIIETTTTARADITSTSTKATTIKTTTEFLKIPTISSDTVEVFDSVEDTSFNGENNKSTKTLRTKDFDTTTVKYTITETIPVFNAKNNNVKTTPVLSNKIKNDKTDTVMRPSESTTPMLVISDEPTITLGVDYSSIAATTTNDNPAKTSGDSGLEKSITTHVPEILPSTSTFAIQPENKTYESSTIADPREYETVTETTKKFTDPFIGKYTQYTTIIRKRVSSSEETTATTQGEEDTMKAETSNTAVNFEQAFKSTLISSLEELGADNRNNDESRDKEKNMIATELSPFMDITSPVTKKTEFVETKRAGYLDNSERITSPTVTSKLSEETTTMQLPTIAMSKDVDNNVKDSEASETESPHQKNADSFESQSQLAEDAMQEELMKEEALQNLEETSKKRKGPSPEKPATGGDELSVQPIEKYRTTLYTVSPNYKPMKKLDVQPARPRLRDPDDNSWRNESISSLGIVFKPKNATKSFKEVLKNKTQTELINTTERVKEELPDLRVRLEKIAEVRKIKKKKTNKDGEVVYTDYEEGSAERAPDLLALLGGDEVYKAMTTPSPPTTSTSAESTTQSTQTTPMSSETTTQRVADTTPARRRGSTQSVFSRLGLDRLTTAALDALFRAEYDDTTDEYDAEYVTMSSIDLKRYNSTSRGSAPRLAAGTPRPPPRPATDAPLPERRPATDAPLPERRPTVQYFPPREHKVSVNSVDTDFERKVNTLTSQEPRAYVTVPAVDVSPPPAAPVSPREYYVTGVPAGRGQYVIKHYRDFLAAAARDQEEESRDAFLPRLPPPPPPAPHLPLQVPPPRTAPHRDPQYKNTADEDYDERFQKEVIDRFVDNFNQNSERFRVDFPILYNSSVVHRAGAASRAFLRRLYPQGAPPPAPGAPPLEPGALPPAPDRPCDNCELNVELSPDYELHYYLPGQEEREQAVTQA